MQAMLLTRSIQEGRSLLTDSNNLAAELEEMTQDDVSIFAPVIKVQKPCAFASSLA